MEPEVKNIFDQFLTAYDIPSAKYKGEWNGYEVYDPDTSKYGYYIGMPLVILVKDKEIRMSTPKEALEFLDYYCKKHNLYNDDDTDEPMEKDDTLSGSGE